MKKIFLCLLFTIISSFTTSQVFAQAQSKQTALQQNIRQKLKLVALGKADEVKRELPDLLAEYPDDTGVRFLHATLVEDATKALSMYERLVREYPRSDWADDARLRIVQMYAMKRDTNRARNELAIFRKNHPDSEFLVIAYDVVRQSVGLPASVAAAIEKQANDRKNSNDEENDKPTISSSKSPEKNSEKHSEIKKEATKNSQVPSKAEVSKEPIKESAKASSQPAMKTITKSEKTNEKPENTDDDDEEISKEPSKYTLQIGVFVNKQTAQAEVEKLNKNRIVAVVKEKVVAGTKKFAVWVGEYPSREKAESARIQVQKYCGCTPLVMGKY